MILFAEDEAPAAISDAEFAAAGLLELASLALALGKTPRITRHPDGQFETVATHTVMLAWCALSLNEAMDLRLDPAEIARFALCHDAPEAICGDTATLRISADERAAKAKREEAAIAEIEVRTAALPWLSRSIGEYESRKGGNGLFSTSADLAAAFVHAVDKIMPKLAHVLNGGVTLGESGIGVDELKALLDRQREDIRNTLPQRVSGSLIELQELLSHMTLDLLEVAP